MFIKKKKETNEKNKWKNSTGKSDLFWIAEIMPFSTQIHLLNENLLSIDLSTTGGP